MLYFVNLGLKYLANLFRPLDLLVLPRQEVSSPVLAGRLRAPGRR
jgi:hypothetical protein